MIDKKREEHEQRNKLQKERREKIEAGLIKVFDRIVEKETISDKELEVLPKIADAFREWYC